jgi:hypothetical protein
MFLESVARGIINSNNFYEVGLKDKSPVTVLWTGEGNQILIPLEMNPAKYPATN